MWRIKPSIAVAAGGSGSDKKLYPEKQSLDTGIQGFD
jgi:hypothetical protein